MIGFNGAFGRKPRKFNYTPRSFDETTDKRTSRRRELNYGGRFGSSAPETPEEYKPGMYVRANSAARGNRFAGQSEGRKGKTARKTLILGAVTIVIVWIFLTI